MPSQKPKHKEQDKLDFTIPTSPDFEEKLRDPLLAASKLPPDFNIKAEAEQLEKLWKNHQQFHQYKFHKFIHAGGSGMVFQVTPLDSENNLALKIARKKLTAPDEKLSPDVAKSLSPVSRRELEALKTLQHSNIVRLFDSIEGDQGIIAIATSFVIKPKPIHEYFSDILLQKTPKGMKPYDPRRLENACNFLLEKIMNIASAIDEMHKNQMYHMDIKPENILMGSDKKVYLTDLGSCIDLNKGIRKGFRVQFSWPYAHPELTDIANEPANISGGGLKATAEPPEKERIGKYDLFAFGRTIQETLAILVGEFKERCYASYGFRYLHLISCLLLDGHNAALADAKKRIDFRHDRHFVNDMALSYDPAFFAGNKIKTASELLDKLERHSKQYAWNEQVPELDRYQVDTINTGRGDQAAFTDRVAAVVNHPAYRRLKKELQLGWIKEVYPNATHDRWSHSVGVFTEIIDYYNALLADPEVPTARIVLDRNDIEHALVAGLIHDLGQSSFGHDFEAACPNIFNHKMMIERIVNDDKFGSVSLSKVLNDWWPNVDKKRILNIINYANKQPEYENRIIDGLAADIIDGPIDADKLDYLVRDGNACGVPYGKGIDRHRFLRALTVTTHGKGKGNRLALAYRSKGSPGIESLMIARYQMYNSVYWHHTFRCIQAMFSHMVYEVFGLLETRTRAKIGTIYLTKNRLQEIFYLRIILGKSRIEINEILKKKDLPSDFLKEAPPEVLAERSLDLVWRFADMNMRSFVERLASRKLYKRFYEIPIADLGDPGLYHKIASKMTTAGRVELANKIQIALFKSIHKRRSEQGDSTTLAEDAAKEKLQELEKIKLPLIVVDFPTKGVPDENNIPLRIEDSSRKYIGGTDKQTHTKDLFFKSLITLQQSFSTFRAFSAPELHVLISRYLMPEDIQKIVQTEFKDLRSVN